MLATGTVVKRTRTQPTVKTQKIALRMVLAAICAVTLPTPAAAQEQGSPDYLARLAQCRAIAEANARLACYDREVGAVVAAGEQGEVRIVDREEVRETRRKLFGFTLPRNLFGGGDDDGEGLDELTTAITQARRSGRNDWLITTAEGSVWRIASPPMRFRPPREGQTVVFKAASLGSYFIRVDGQTGVKGVRVE